MLLIVMLCLAHKIQDRLNQLSEIDWVLDNSGELRATIAKLEHFIRVVDTGQ
jgi:hypothetical protein